MTRYQGWRAMAANLSREDRELLAKACCYEERLSRGRKDQGYAFNRAEVAIEDAFASKTGI